MVEGHQCHRVAAAHRRLLVGRSFIARSPNGRFKEGAAAINAKPLQRIEVHGKNLFYFFSPKPISGLPPPLPLPLPLPSPLMLAEDSANPQTATHSARPSSPGSVPSPSGQSSNSSGMDPVADAHAGDGDGDGGGDGVSDPVVMHVHFGMSGAFRTMSLPGPPPSETTRLELVNEEMGLVAHLSAMTVAHGSLALYTTKASQLGPDPLREDADKELLWSKVTRSRKPIGLVLMDQSMVAGVGNIYRAEILFKAGVHPELPACGVSRELFDKIWYHSVDLLQRGFVTGSIITVDPDEARVLGRPWTRRYIYNQESCGRCKGPVRTWDMAARTVYCCETCQPLRHPASQAQGQGEQQQQQQQGKEDEEETAAAAAAAAAAVGSGGGGAMILSPARLAAMAAARPARLFRSHCAPDETEVGEMAPAKLTVRELKARLTAFNLDTSGTKAQLVERLEAALRWQQQQQQQPEQLRPETRIDVVAKAVTAITATVVTAVTAVTARRGGQVRKTEGEEETEVEKVAKAEVVNGQGGVEAERGAAAVDMAARGSGAAATQTPLPTPTPKATPSPTPQAHLRPCGNGDLVAREGSPGGDGGADGDNSDVTLDRAERILTDSMAANTPGALPSPLRELPRLTVVQLRSRLRELGLPTSGTKPMLLERLTAALNVADAAAAAAASPQTALEEAEPAEVAGVADAAAAAAEVMLAEAMDEPVTPRPAIAANGPIAAAAAVVGGTLIATAPPRPCKAPRPFVGQGNLSGAWAAARAAAVSPVPFREYFTAAGTPTTAVGVAGVRGAYDIQPGIRGLEARMTSARDAVLEKLLAGENRAVEHVALEEDDVVDLLAERNNKTRGPKARRKRSRSLAADLEAAAAVGMEEAERDGEYPEEVVGSSSVGNARREKTIAAASTVSASSEQAVSQSGAVVAAATTTAAERPLAAMKRRRSARRP